MCWVRCHFDCYSHEDNTNTGYVSVFKFADFMDGFGPLNTVMKRVTLGN